jgi:hypothetical protein
VNISDFFTGIPEAGDNETSLARGRGSSIHWYLEDTQVRRRLALTDGQTFLCFIFPCSVA